MVERLGRGFLGVETNLANIKNTEDIISQAVTTFGKADILVNNAGIIRRCDALFPWRRPRPFLYRQQERRQGLGIPSTELL
jgi:NAD(P)-dependent dehydrogenase (short-subunit alcohol dehydrogenase family)